MKTKTQTPIKLSDHFTYKRIFRFVLPSVVMMVFTSIYGVVDGVFVTTCVGKTQFAALNLIMPLVMILGGTGFMIGTGGAALVSKTLGEGDKEKANRYFSMMILFTVIAGVILSALGMAFVRPVAKLFGASEAMLPHCVTYGRIVIGFTTFFMMQNVFQSFFVAAEKPRLGLYVTIAAGVTNAVLDALFMAVFRWGLAGAAVATGIGQMVGSVIPVCYFARKNDSLLQLKWTKLQFSPIIKALFNGSSELMTNVTSSVVSMLYNKQLMHFLGEDGVSAYGVLMYVQLIFVGVEIGYSIGSAPVVGYHYGAANKDELKSLFRKSMVSMSVAGVVLAALAEAVAVPLSYLFSGKDEALFALTVHAFRIFSISFIFSGINIYSSGFFTALNDGAVSAILSLLRGLLYQVTFVFALPAVWGVEGVWWAIVATEVCAFVTAAIFFAAKKKKYGYA